MEEITAYFLSLLEIIEKEGKLLKLIAVRTGKGLSWFAVGVLLLGIGILLLAWSLFTAVSLMIGSVAARLAASVLILAGGGIFLWLGKTNFK